MFDILHTVQVHASPAEVFSALTGRAAQSRGWTRESGTSPRLDSLAEFRFGEGNVLVKMRVAALEDGARVAWRCVEGPPDWIGTLVTFDLARDEDADETVVRFGHRNWKHATDLMGRCSAKWASFLFNLKSLVETPEPDDLYI